MYVSHRWLLELEGLFSDGFFFFVEEVVSVLVPRGSFGNGCENFSSTIISLAGFDFPLSHASGF